MRSRRLILLLTLVFSTADLLADFAVTNLKIATDAVDAATILAGP